MNSMAEVSGESGLLLSCGVCIAQILREVTVAPLVSRSLSTSEEKSLLCLQQSPATATLRCAIIMVSLGFLSMHAHV